MCFSYKELQKWTGCLAQGKLPHITPQYIASGLQSSASRATSCTVQIWLQLQFKMQRGSPTEHSGTHVAGEMHRIVLCDPEALEGGFLVFKLA